MHLPVFNNISETFFVVYVHVSNNFQSSWILISIVTYMVKLTVPIYITGLSPSYNVTMMTIKTISITLNPV